MQTELELRALSQNRALEQYLARESGAATVSIHSASLLSGGAVQESWKIDADFSGSVLAGSQALVLRADATTQLAASLSRVHECVVLRVAHTSGVLVPEPLYCCDDRSVIGRPFFVMKWIAGQASGASLVHNSSSRRRGVIAERLARELALIHRIKPPHPALALALGEPPTDPALSRIELYRRWLDDFADPHPVAEWALRWLDRRRPTTGEIVLCHGDFRTGNYLVNEAGPTAILDWEFASWGDPHEDIGWFCCKSWRCGALDREAGGLVSRDVFCRAYEAHSGRSLDRERLHYWEVMASLRWLILALQQRDRFSRGGERSLALALTGRRPAECEFEILRLTDAGTL